MNDQFPRRGRIDQYSSGERAIREALLAVEEMGADPRLTDAVCLLGAAQESVADFVDGECSHRRVITEKPGPAFTPVRDPAVVRTDYSREELVAICERAVVPHAKWSNRDTPGSHEKLGLAWVMLKAGCEFSVHPSSEKSGCFTGRDVIWLTIYWRNFNDFEYGTGPSESDSFYLPTPERLAKVDGRDWHC